MSGKNSCNVGSEGNQGLAGRTCGRPGVTFRPTTESHPAQGPAGEGIGHRSSQEDKPQQCPDTPLHSGQDLDDWFSEVKATGKTRVLLFAYRLPKTFVYKLVCIW